MEDNSRKDITKSVEREKLLNYHAKEKAFDILDKTAKGLSNLRTDMQETKEAPKEQDTNEKEEQQESPNEGNSEGTFESKLKTNENINENSKTSNNDGESTSKLKTNVNNDSKEKESGVKDQTISKSKLKTAVSKKITKTFGFNENQGKISKSVTVVSKAGKGISKAGQKITRASKDLDTAISSDRTGKDFLKTKIERKGKKIVKNKVVKPITKPIKKVTKKVTAPLRRKMAQALKFVMKKAIKLIVSAVCAIPEIIIPLAVFICVVAFVGSVFGGSGKNTIPSYQSYMDTIQESYDKEVDNFLKENPDGLVFGVRGNYGKIDWRVPLIIMQGTVGEVSFDQAEKTLLQKFKEAELFEKHIILEKTSTTGSGESEVTKTTKMMVILNPGLEEYLEWIDKNFSIIKTFLNSKRVINFNQNSFADYQLELIKSLYTSEDYFNEFEPKYKDITIKFGINNISRNLNSDNYNSKNTLATNFKGQCTWYSLGRALESMNLNTPATNAETWISNGIAMGFNTGTQPHANSIAVQVGTSSGHVAYIESYEGATITVSEGNVGNACSGNKDCSQVEYAKAHANELVRTKTYNSFLEYKRDVESSGKYLFGFLYLD